MLISYKDWIAGKHHLDGRLARVQEDILSDDGFPDTSEYDEMIAYLKKQNASGRFISTFRINYRRYKREVLDRYSLEQTERKRGRTSER